MSNKALKLLVTEVVTTVVLTLEIWFVWNWTVVSIWPGTEIDGWQALGLGILGHALTYRHRREDD